MLRDVIVLLGFPITLRYCYTRVLCFHSKRVVQNSFSRNSSVRDFSGFPCPFHFRQPSLMEVRGTVAN